MTGQAAGFLIRHTFTGENAARSGLNRLTQICETVLSGQDKWWYAWNEVELALPDILTDPAQFYHEPAWERIVVFSRLLEVRLQRLSDMWAEVVILTEDPALRQQLAGPQAEVTDFRVIRDSTRFLAFSRLSLRTGEKQVRVAWGAVRFPRVVQTGLSPDPSKTSELPSIQVKQYYNDSGELVVTRYVAWGDRGGSGEHQQGVSR
ncbi:MAG: hypothetical protein IMX00_08750 [Limnochordales bacterium]|nr:hypothetical protein [Limnochordales bacterium]